MVTARDLHDMGAADGDLRGKVVVDPYGHRLGEVRDILAEGPAGGSRPPAGLLSVVSGGILGMDSRELRIPVAAVTKVDERVHVQVTAEAAARDDDSPEPGPS